jgi:hypothetical protein
VSQFATVDELAEQWRADGFDHEDLETWAIGFPGQEGLVDDFASDLDAALFVDSEEDAVFTSWQATSNDLFVIDRDGIVVERVDVAYNSLSERSNREHLDRLVRRLLEP